MKRRMIIADPDIDYSIKLLEQFSIHYRDLLDIHVITDPDYFYDYFNSGQGTDVLVASEDFHYSRFEERQIEKLFWLTENQNIPLPDNDRVEYLYKYSSLSNLMSRIGKDLGAGGENGDDTCRLIVVTSPNGGTGKTTIATALARMQQELQRKVLYFDASNIQNCTCLFSDEDEIPLSTDQKLADQISFSPYSTLSRYIRTEGFDYLPAFDSSLSEHDIPLSMFTDFLEKVTNDSDYDVIIADVASGDPGFQKEFLERANHIVVVAEHTRGSFCAMNKFLSVLKDQKGVEVSVILNKFRRYSDLTDTMSLIPLPGQDSTDARFSFAIEEVDQIQSMKCRDLVKHPFMSKLVQLCY